MNTRSIFYVAALSLSAIVFTGCHSVRRGEPITGPMQLDTKQQRGRLVFLQRCHQCHPNGEAGLGPALNNKPAPVFLMKTQVRLGLGAMPRFDTHAIPDNDLSDLMSYVMALRKADAGAEASKKSNKAESKRDHNDDAKEQKEEPTTKTSDRRPVKS